MPARHGICRGLTFGADHNKSGLKRRWIETLPVGTEGQTGGLPMCSLKSQVQRQLQWRPWVPAIGRNKTQQETRVPLGTEY